MQTPETPAARFEAFAAPARARPELWRLAAGMALATAVWIAAVLGLSLALGGGDVRRALLGYLFGFAGLILGLALALRLFHHRGLATLLGPGGFRPREFAIGIAVVAVVAGTPALIGGWFAPLEQARAAAAWAPWVPLALAALFVQVSAEELAFRGYLQQQLAVRFARRAVWWVLPAALFGALHWQGAFGPNAWLVAAAAGVAGLVYGDVTARRGNLSAAIGLHLANNAFALLIVAPQGALGAFGLFVSPVDPADTAEMRAALIANLTVTLAAWGAWRARAAWLARALQSRGAGSI